MASQEFPSTVVAGPPMLTPWTNVEPAPNVESAPERVVHRRSVTVSGSGSSGVTSTEAVAELAPNFAVTVTVALFETFDAVTGNFTVAAPLGIVTKLGTVSAVLLDETLRDPPPVPTLRSVAVHVETPPGTSEPGEHCRLEILDRELSTRLSTPLITESEARVPSGAAPNAMLIGSDTLLPVLDAATVTLRVATTPLRIVLVFMPVAKQTIDPLRGLHESVFPAPVRAGPAAALSERILPGAYDIVHCNPAGALPETLFKDKSKETDPPGVAEPDARLNVLSLRAEMVTRRAIDKNVPYLASLTLRRSGL